MITATRQRPFYSWHRQISIQIRKSDCSIILHITFSSLVTLFFSVLQHTLHFSASHAFLSLPVSSPGATPSSLVPPDPSCPHPQNHSLHFPTTSSSQNVSVGHDLGAYQKPAPLNTRQWELTSFPWACFHYWYLMKKRARYQIATSVGLKTTATVFQLATSNLNFALLLAAGKLGPRKPTTIRQAPGEFSQ